MDQTIKTIKTNHYTYLLKKEIGNGSTSKVFYAIEQSESKPFAVKEISKSYLSNKRNKQHILNEIELLKTLKHNNLISLNSTDLLFEDSDNLYLFFEYCNGGDLYDYLQFNLDFKKKAIPEDEIRFIFKQVCEGLKYLYSKKIMHRDIKLENILLNFADFKCCRVDYKLVDIKKVCVKICDLGFSKILASEMTYTCIGTPIYMAPEMINSNEKYSISADLWSIGIFLYEMYVGKTPFFSFDRQKLNHLINEGNYYLPEDLFISHEGLDLLIRLLQKESKNRLTFEEILLNPFLNKENLRNCDLRFFSKEGKVELTTSMTKLEKKFVIDDNIQVCLWDKIEVKTDYLIR